MKPVKKDSSRRKKKKPYSPPLLTVHGTVEKITKGGTSRNVEKAMKTTGSQLQGM